MAYIIMDFNNYEEPLALGNGGMLEENPEVFNDIESAKVALKTQYEDYVNNYKENCEELGYDYQEDMHDLVMNESDTSFTYKYGTLGKGGKFSIFELVEVS